MARVLKYPAYCFSCNKLCDPSEEKEKQKIDSSFRLSFLHRDYKSKTWKAHCYDCYKSTRQEENA